MAGPIIVSQNLSINTIDGVLNTKHLINMGTLWSKLPNLSSFLCLIIGTQSWEFHVTNITHYVIILLLLQQVL